MRYKIFKFLTVFFFVAGVLAMVIGLLHAWGVVTATINYLIWVLVVCTIVSLLVSNTKKG